MAGTEGWAKGPEEEPSAFTRWETGYRGWKLRFKEGEPRLGSLTGMGPSEGIWEPEDVEDVDPISGLTIVGKEVRSDWSGESDEPFEQTNKGLYSLRSLEDVKGRYPREDVYGAITPYGKTFHGSMGFRSEKAAVRAIFKNALPCYVCNKVAEHFVHNDERFALCGKCLLRLEKLIRGKGYTDEEVESLLHKLADAYGADLVDYSGSF